jgi:hypothetical protein
MACSHRRLDITDDDGIGVACCVRLAVLSSEAFLSSVSKGCLTCILRLRDSLYGVAGRPSKQDFGGPARLGSVWCSILSNSTTWALAGANFVANAYTFVKICLSISCLMPRCSQRYVRLEPHHRLMRSWSDHFHYPTNFRKGPALRDYFRS